MTDKKYTTEQFNRGCVIYSTLENFVSSPPNKKKYSKKELDELKHYLNVVDAEFNDESLSIKGISITVKKIYEEDLKNKL